MDPFIAESAAAHRSVARTWLIWYTRAWYTEDEFFTRLNAEQRRYEAEYQAIGS